MSYAEQMARLTARKIEQTRVKQDRLGARDEDDYGLVLPPESFKADLPVRDLEVNRDHPLLRNLLRMFKADENDAVLTEMTQNLFDACLLIDGYLKDPQALASRAQTMLNRAAAWYTEVRKI